ncbi:hypothetical protein IID24_00740 [Patescibacteria group bacterium]|nr:hypothetical protein [Patescibacteria group bacterium]
MIGYYSKQAWYATPPLPPKTIRLEDLEKQFDQILKGVTIEDDYLKLALDYLKEVEKTEVNSEGTITKSLQEAYNDCQTRLKSLHEAYISPQNSDHGIYMPEEFKQHKAELIRERDGIKQQLGASESNVDHTLELSERTFNFCTYARYHFNNGDLRVKRTIFSSIGSNLTLKDKRLTVELYQPYMLIQREIESQLDLIVRLEPIKSTLIKGETDDPVSVSPSWLRD